MYIWRRKYANSIPCFRLQILSLFSWPQVATEIDKSGHCDRNYDDERREEIKEELDCKFIRINLNEEIFNKCKAINEIYRYIIKSTTKF